MPEALSSKQRSIIVRALDHEIMGLEFRINNKSGVSAFAASGWRQRLVDLRATRRAVLRLTTVEKAA